MDATHTINGKPIDATAAAAQTSAPVANTGNDVHKDSCGQVGITGLHGKLGTNAKGN